MLLTLGINVIGIMSFLFYERQQRVAFLETRQSLETKLILEQESREQVSRLEGSSPLSPPTPPLAPSFRPIPSMIDLPRP